MSDNDGGPAFPSVGEGFGDPKYSARGMSLRDWFAGMALMGLVGPNGSEYAGWMADEAYALADAMLAKKREPTNDE